MNPTNIDKSIDRDILLDKEIINEDIFLDKGIINEDIFVDETDNNVVEVENKVDKSSKNDKQKQFENIVKLYLSNLKNKFTNKNIELEAKFGTRGIKPLTKNDYDNVIKKLKSFGFDCMDENGVYRLSINNEFIDRATGNFRLSNIRTEISGLHSIQNYCKTNNINETIKEGVNNVVFTKKDPVFNDDVRVYPVNFDDFNFRVTLNNEDTNPQSKKIIMINWLKSKKTFRYINRVTFVHKDYPFKVDISILKQSDLDSEGNPMKYYTTEESGIFGKPEKYEIEIEVDNSMVQSKRVFDNYENILTPFRKVIKFILSGLQGTDYPVSYPEQRQVSQSYSELIYKNNTYKRPMFVGPSSYTLQMQNVSNIDENSNVPNIRNNFVVTEKADGDRHLMYINNIGKVYLINTNINIIFTGAETPNKELYNSLIDGELVLQDKTGKFINLYMAFDIYYLNKQDLRSLTFMPYTTGNKSRYWLLKKLIAGLNLSSVDKNIMKTPITVNTKQFYPENVVNSNIFSACNDIIGKINNNLFEYETDGLIFTHAYFGVGSEKIGEAGPLSNKPWVYSFKWKPPKYNTIDFLVKTIKSPSGEDVVSPIFENGINSMLNTQLQEYKTIQLNCSFSIKRDGYINPCQDVIDDNLPKYKNSDSLDRNDIAPEQFYPTSPYDPTAGICKIMLRGDDNNVKQMFTEENEVFLNDTIVEFSYNFEHEKGWRWVPLRVRYDKTAAYKQGQRNYGNAYYVANSNWKSIHNPITEDMIRTGANIQDLSVADGIYYNKTSSASFKTEGLKNFHNLYVKKLLISSVSKRGDTLIDYACGKGGDFPKWINSNLSFVFGIDISEDNLENRLDGACARYLNFRKDYKNMPHALFVNGNSALNIRNGSAMLNDKAIQTTKAVFGTGVNDENKIGKGVSRQYGKGLEGFNISSCQFALHYLLKNPDSLQGFLRNLSECTKLGGYFIGTAYDGKLIFELLKKKNTGESIQIVEDDKKIWEIVKGYNSNTFDDDASSLGYRIDVYQESINQLITEYLINFEYLNRVMENYGFKLIDKSEANNMGLPEGSGLFSELYLNMINKIKSNNRLSNDYGQATNMTASEKTISFLNRYFVYKKFRVVDESKVQIDISDIAEEIDNVETKQAVKIGVDEVLKNKPKIIKLNKKIILNADSQSNEKITKSNEKATKGKKKLIISE